MRKQVPLVGRRLYDTNDVIVEEGEVGNSFYLIESGTVEVFKNKGRAEIIIGYIKKDGIFGEMALVDGDRRSASVRAIEPTVCRVFSARIFSIPPRAQR
ncbi:cyclic nucleotide-binding domain-containing protein [Elstera litoralis]|uniref:cyclic nucleotide-binding domain-containing protein n=1 Tax=Elstera litoralis TaxID=552518 RepID=UPI000A055F55|nr:cyclic nucleotide-binding domain-containing protein [Elstera litoralis]